MENQITSLLTDHALIDGQRIAYGVHGSGEPVVLIHGTPFFSHIWRHLTPELIASGYRVHLYDLLGFGHSERPHNPAVDTSVSGQLPILRALLNLWQLEQTQIVAHDIGGAIAQQLGIYHTERVKSLTLIDSVSYDSWPSRRTKEQMQAGLENLINAKDAEHREHYREWLFTTTEHRERLKNSSLETYIDMISGPVGQGSLYQHQVMHYDPVHTEKLTEHLHKLGQLPVQLIWGRKDQWQVTDWAERLHADIPNSSLHILDECGHLVMEDQPKQLNALVQTFLGSHRD